MQTQSASKELARMILATVVLIPFGKVASYGQIAAMAGLPRHARLVGRVLSELENDAEVPWHRVINSQGAISLKRVDALGQNIQQMKLMEEGIILKNGKVNFRQYGWFE